MITEQEIVEYWVYHLTTDSPNSEDNPSSKWGNDQGAGYRLWSETIAGGAGDLYWSVLNEFKKQAGMLPDAPTLRKALAERLVRQILKEHPLPKFVVG